MTQPEIDWEAVYWEQTPRLYNFFRYRTGSSEDAQDLTAQTMGRAWRYRQHYRSDLGAFEAWLFQIARNLAVDHMQHRRFDISLDAVPDLAADESVEQEVQQRQNAARLYVLLADLPLRDQELVALKYGAGLTNRSIARIVGMSESNVGTLLHRIVQRLRQEWGVLYEERG